MTGMELDHDYGLGLDLDLDLGADRKGAEYGPTIVWVVVAYSSVDHTLIESILVNNSDLTDRPRRKSLSPVIRSFEQS